MKTLSFRIKDSRAHRRLAALSHAVNQVWNFCNETQRTALARSSARLIKDKKTGKEISIPNFLSAYEFHKFLSGSSKLLGLHSQTVQAVAEQYATRRKQAKKRWLRWRSGKKSLGWIPFKASGVKVNGDSVAYAGHTFRFWLTRDLGKIKSGNFSQDSRGRWYVNFVVDDTDNLTKAGPGEVGIDLGLKTLATCSDGKKYNARRYTKKYERLLALAQKDNKKRRVKNIHAKIKNSRKDFSHKVSHELTRDHKLIVVGDVSSAKLAKTKFAKSVLDAGWSQLRTFLKYKALAREGIYVEVNEAFTTSTCSGCLASPAPGSPRGLKGLSLREWVCSNCGAVHDRDVNAALNILRLGHQALGLKGFGNPRPQSRVAA